MVFAQEETAKAYVRKIYRYFVKSEWDQEVENDIITPLSAQLIASDYNVLDVLKTLLQSKHFYDEDDLDSSNEIIGSIVKNPIQLLSETLSLLQIELPNPAASSANPPTSWTTDQDNFYKFYFNFCYFGYFAGAGMNPFSPETVAGYPSDYQTPDFDRSWFSSNTLFHAINLLNVLSLEKIKSITQTSTFGCCLTVLIMFITLAIFP